MANSFQTLHKVIQTILKDYGLEKTVKEHMAIAVWSDVVGDRIGKITEPWKVSDGKLFIRVKNSTWRTELAMMKNQIREKLNRKIGKDVIKEIIFV